MIESITEYINKLTFNIKLVDNFNIDFFSIIDILIISFIIYIILIWARETRAWSLLKGIGVLLFVSIISYTFNLYTLSWIISNTFNVGVMAIIIIFQPEIRKALEKLGTSSSNSLNINLVQKKEISAETLDAILMSVYNLAEQRIGALIAIENQVPLGDHISTGVAIEAKVTNQLLCNIFEDRTPLHDGAVVIRNNKIASASCILPLTKRNIGQELGTRHRAGIGLTEISDSFVLIVSEEKGRVSLAYKGELQRGINIDELRKKIRFEGNDGNSKKSKRKKKIRWTKRGG